MQPRARTELIQHHYIFCKGFSLHDFFFTITLFLVTCKQNDGFSVRSTTQSVVIINGYFPRKTYGCVSDPLIFCVHFVRQFFNEHWIDGRTCYSLTSKTHYRPCNFGIIRLPSWKSVFFLNPT